MQCIIHHTKSFQHCSFFNVRACTLSFTDYSMSLYLDLDFSPAIWVTLYIREGYQQLSWKIYHVAQGLWQSDCRLLKSLSSALISPHQMKMRFTFFIKNIQTGLKHWEPACCSDLSPLCRICWWWAGMENDRFREDLDAEQFISSKSNCPIIDEIPA